MKYDLPEKKVTCRDFKPYLIDNMVFDLYILTETKYDKVDDILVTNVLGVYSSRKAALNGAVYWRQNHKGEQQSFMIECQPLDGSPFSYLDIESVDFTDSDETKGNS